MSRRRRYRRLTDWIVRGLLIALVLTLVGGAAAWLAFERIPGWYVPVEVSQADLARVRNGLPNTYQSLSEQAIGRAPFDFSISERTVTEWVVARGELYPEAQGWLPDWVRDPVVCFRDGKCIVGARIDYQGWRTILGIHLTSSVAEDTLTVRLDKVTAGAVPIPISRLAGLLDDLLDARRLDVSVMPDPVAQVVRALRERGPAALIEEGATFPNNFELRNGRRRLRITSMDGRDGRLVVRLTPA